MSTDVPNDKGIALSFLFTTQTAEQMQDWIDMGYFKDHSDIAASAFGMVQKAVQFLKQDKKVVGFNSITINMEVDIPESKEKRSLQ